MVPKDWKIIEKSVCGNGEVIQIDYDRYDSNLADLIQ